MSSQLSVYLSLPDGKDQGGASVRDAGLRQLIESNVVETSGQVVFNDREDLFRPTDEQLTVEEFVASHDALILVVGLRDLESNDEDDRWFAEDEYTAALRAGIRILAFFVPEDADAANLPLSGLVTMGPEQVEMSTRLQQFRNRVASEVVIREFRTPRDLVKEILEAFELFGNATSHNDTVRPEEFSQSVRSVRDDLGASSPVTAGEVVAALQRSHPGYGNGLFGDTSVTAQGDQRTTDEWLAMVRQMYDLDRVAKTRHQLVDGRLAVAALAEFDSVLKAELDDSGFLSALAEEIEIQPGSIGTTQSASDFAVLISFEKYDSESVTSLRGQSERLANLAAVLDRWGFSTSLIENQSAADVIQSLRTTVRATGDTDQLLIYWGGHGVLVNDSLHLVATDSDPIFEKNLIDARELGAAISDEANTKQIMVMLDTAHAGAAMEDLIGALSTSEVGSPSSGLVIASAAATEVPTDRGFTEAVIAALDPPTDDNRWLSADEFVSAVELAGTIERAYVERTRNAVRMRWSSWGDATSLIANPYLIGTPPFSERIVPSSDAAASHDRLRRASLARTVNDQMVEVRPTLGDETAFGLMLDGPWGSGKSSLLNLIEADLEQREGSEAGWLPIRFDAWRESQVGPTWWSLLGALSDAVRPKLGLRGRLSLWFRSRRQLVGTPILVGTALGVLAVAFATIGLVAADVELTLTESTKVVGMIGSLIVIAGTLRAVGATTTRALSLRSSSGARRLEASSASPTDLLARQLELVLEVAPETPLLIIDDLDRCETSYVVELLDAIQTLIRTRAAERNSGRQPLFFIVAADGRWVRAAYENQHGHFVETIAEPGKPLGYLFTEKLFQITVPVPPLSDSQRKDFLRFRLFGGDSEAAEDDQTDEPEPIDGVRAATRQLEVARTADEVASVTARVSAEVHDAIFETAVARQRAVESSEALQHRLERYHPLLPANPRAITRFVMEFAVIRSARRAEGEWLPTDPLARWVVVRTRWPALADFLAMHPEAIAGSGPDLPAELASIPDLQDAQEILTEDDVPFTVERLRQCAGSPGNREYEDG